MAVPRCSHCITTFASACCCPSAQIAKRCSAPTEGPMRGHGSLPSPAMRQLRSCQAACWSQCALPIFRRPWLWTRSWAKPGAPGPRRRSRCVAMPSSSRLSFEGQAQARAADCDGAALRAAEQRNKLAAYPKLRPPGPHHLCVRDAVTSLTWSERDARRPRSGGQPMSLGSDDGGVLCCR